MTRGLIPRSLFDALPWIEDEDSLGFHQNSGLSVFEESNDVVVEAALPGIKPDEVEVTHDKGTLWIKAEKQEEAKEKKYYRKAAKSFSYCVNVPGEVDENAEPEASFENGVMQVRFRKKEQRQPKKIQIRST